jgi:hypothetical protein
MICVLGPKGRDAEREFGGDELRLKLEGRTVD